MDRDLLLNITLCVIIALLLIAYAIYVMIDEQKKMKYYKSTLKYETDWDKYNTMLDKQKRILFSKKAQLMWLKTLVMFKRLIKWN